MRVVYDLQGLPRCFGFKGTLSILKLWSYSCYVLGFKGGHNQAPAALMDRRSICVCVGGIFLRPGPLIFDVVLGIRCFYNLLT